jgi:hypothetical protein
MPICSTFSTEEREFESACSINVNFKLSINLYYRSMFTKSKF